MCFFSFPLVCLMKRKMDLTTEDKFESLEDFRNGVCSTTQYWAGEDLLYYFRIKLRYYSNL